MDLAGSGGSAAIKFAGIALCFAYSVYISAKGGDKLAAVGVGFAMCADVFLLLLDTLYALGVALFLCAQVAYFSRIYRHNGGKSAAALHAGSFAAAAIVLAAMKMLTPLNALCALYFTFFACNVYQSFGAKNRLFSIGLSLFICCDICVGLHNAPFALPLWLTQFAALGMWTFYLPSQVLITLSGRMR